MNTLKPAEIDARNSLEQYRKTVTVGVIFPMVIGAGMISVAVDHWLRVIAPEQFTARPWYVTGVAIVAVTVCGVIIKRQIAAAKAQHEGLVRHMVAPKKETVSQTETNAAIG